MSFHQLSCDRAEQRACNAILRGIAGRDADLRRTEDPDLHTDWLSWPLGEWVAFCTVKSLDEPDEWVMEFEVRLRNAATSEVFSRRFDRTGGEIRHARHWVTKCVSDPEYRERWRHESAPVKEDRAVPKRTSSKNPKNAVIVRTYQEFFHEVEAFDCGERNLLIVVGPPGTSKSTAVRRQLKNARVIEGGSTPYRLYIELYENRNLPIVLDDADKVFRDKNGVFLLKLLTQTETAKTIQWNSNTPEIRSGELESEFITTSPTLIVANSWPQENPDIAAIESRGHLIYLVPSFPEMHRYAKEFFHDDEIYDFIALNLPFFDNLDLRLYFKAQEIKATGLRTGKNELWKWYIERQMMGADKRVALDLIHDKSFVSDNQRAKEFSRITGATGRTFSRYRDEIASRPR